MPRKTHHQDDTSVRGPSPWFWQFFDDLLITDPSLGVRSGSDFTDFTNVLTSNAGLLTGSDVTATSYQSTSTTIKSAITINSVLNPGGIAEFALDNTASHMIQTEMGDGNSGSFSAIKNTGGKMAAECRIAFQSASTGSWGFFFGLGVPGLSGSASQLLASSAAFAATSYIGVYCLSGSVCTIKGGYASSSATPTVVGTLVAPTPTAPAIAYSQYSFLKLGFSFSPNLGANALVFYVNGQSVATKADVGGDSNWPDSIALVPCFAFYQPSSGQAAQKFDVDWYEVAQAV